MSFGPLHRALMATTVIAGLFAAAGSAHAQTRINGGAPSVVFGGGSSLAFPTYIATFTTYSNGDTTVGWNWLSKGSGDSQCGFINNFPTAFDASAAATQNVNLAASDGFLSQAQISIFNNGYTGTGDQAGAASSCRTTNAAGTSSITLTYPTTAPAAIAGPIIQLPTFGTPVTLAYNIDGVRPGNNRVNLTDDQICGIFSGAITTFNDARLQTAGTGLPNSAATIHPTYRSDGSGTSFLFTQHLRAVCTAATSTADFAARLGTTAPTTSFASLFSTVPSNFRSAVGSGNIVITLGFPGDGSTTAGINGIGYLSPDFTKIAPAFAGRALPYVAEVRNATTGVFTLPDVAGTALALSTATPPTGAQLADPRAYVPPIPNPPRGYPIVGYTTFDLFQCYRDANKALGIAAYVGALYTASTNTLSQNGFAQLASSFLSVINANILNPSPARLAIEDPTVCAPTVNLDLAGFVPAGGTIPGR